MIELVKHIRQSEMTDRLYGSALMDKLVVSVYDPIDYFKESLHITFDHYANVWIVRYFAERYKDPEFVRIYSTSQLIEKFDHFIKMIKW